MTIEDVQRLMSSFKNSVQLFSQPIEDTSRIAIENASRAG